MICNWEESNGLTSLNVIRHLLISEMKSIGTCFFSYPSSKGFDIFLTWLFQVVPVKNGKPADEDDDSADEDMESEEDEKVWS